MSTRRIGPVSLVRLLGGWRGARAGPAYRQMADALRLLVLDGRLPLAGCVLLVSGRASFELVQKAILAGIPLLAAVSAPSSLAVDLAEEAGLSLVGFLRGPSMNVYTGAHRLSD